MAIEDDFNSIQAGQAASNIEQDFNSIQAGQAASNIEQDFNSLGGTAQSGGIGQFLMNVPDSQEQVGGQSVTDQQKAAEETKALIGDPKDPNFDTSGLEPWEYQNGLVTGTKRRPGFMKKLDLMIDGTHRGISHFTLGLMSMLPFGEKYQKAIKDTDASIEAQQQKNIKTYDSWMPQIGEFGGEMLATMPIGGLLGKIGTKAMGLAKGEAILPSVSSLALPTGTKLLGAYGGAGVAGAGVLSGTEALKYQGDQFDIGKAADKFMEGMEQPANYLLPAAGTAIGRYLGKSREYNKVVDSGIDVLPRDLMDSGTQKKATNLVLDSLALINPFSRRAEQLDNIGESIGNIIKKISGQPTAMSTDDLSNYASNALQKGLQRLNKMEKSLWNKGFKDLPVTNLEETYPFIISSLRMLKDAGISNHKLIENKINFIMDNSKLDFGAVKDIGKVLGDAASGLRVTRDPVNISTSNRLFKMRKAILDVAAAKLPLKDQADYNAAKVFSQKKYDLEEHLPLIKDAVTSEIEAKKIVMGLLSDTPTFNKKRILQLMPIEGQNAVKAAKIAEALSKSSNPSGGINLNQFIKNVKVFQEVPELTTKSASTTQALLGNQYTHIQGLLKHLDSINEAKKAAGYGKLVLPMLGAGALAGGAAINSDNWPAVASYSALLLAANHPTLKKLLGVMTRNLSESTYQNLNKKIQSLFIRAGYNYNDDGSLTEQKGK